ncbi:MAG: glucoamylase family protein, partial [Bdellovibrionota bacterium]
MKQADQHPFYDDVLNLMRDSPDGIRWEPGKDEIYSTERLEQHARQMARELKVIHVKRGHSLSPALQKAHKELLSSYEKLTEAIRLKASVSPAAEWFVDNFHIVEDQLRDIRKHLPPSYYRGLPKISEGQLTGYPRVYVLALSLLVHTDCRLDAAMLRRYVRAFQEVSPLSIGELWAVSISLRLALIEFLKPLAIRIVRSRENRDLANTLADHLLKIAAETDEGVAEKLSAELSRRLGSPETFDRAYIVQLIQRLRNQDSDVWPAYEWIEDQLRTQATDTFQLAQLEHQRQAAAQVTVGNIISSMRLLSALDWKIFFESVSLVDDVLSEDPAGVYSKMEFVTRDRYRHEIERLGRGSKLNEIEIAQRLVEKSSTASTDKMRHVGFSLVGDGARDFEKLISYVPRLSESVGRSLRRNPTRVYFGLLVGLSAIIELPLFYYFLSGKASLLLGAIWAVLLLIPISEVALAIMNHFITRALRPDQLPKIDLEKGVPEEARTMVVVPTLFTSVAGVENLLQDLHIRYLANRDNNIYYALLGDFGDAADERSPNDEAILKAVLDGVARLNDEHLAYDFKRFHVFNRKRLWCESEEKWIGWERKRGKIEEFNRLLRGDKETTFDTVTAPHELLSSIKYVITLDTDTQLPRDAARRLIGCMLHPLNKPEYDKIAGRVCSGYSILQPRISVALSGSLRTRFSRIFAGNTGIDPYTTAVSDVYQDLFREGSFTGKGLYDVDAFQEALHGKVPNARLLSHDLFEGCYARCALVTDIELFDDYPANFGTFARRLHRWTRGDWQLAQWILPRIPDGNAKLFRNPFSLISRWKIADNLRRSLYAPTFLAAFIVAWTGLLGSPLQWTLALLALPLVPLFLSFASTMLGFRKNLHFAGYLRNLRSSIGDLSIQYLSTLIFLPELAWTQADAIVRALFRVHISKKKILEWVSFAQDQGRAQKTKGSLWQGTGAGLIVGILTVVEIFLRRDPGFEIESVIPLLWLLSPAVKSWLAKAPNASQRPLTKNEIETFRNYARRTWRFFDTFVGPEDNWLAPDNFQEDPRPVVAHRTSPTNIGLQLLSACSAYDLGYLTALELADTLEKTVASMKKMEKLRGHFFNWYDTHNLEPLNPRYLSTVDSGNLAAHLLAVKQSCLAIALKKTPLRHNRRGLLDTLRILREEVSRETPDTREMMDMSSLQARETISLVIRDLQSKTEESASEWIVALRDAIKKLQGVEDFFEALSANHAQETFEDTRYWLHVALKHMRSIEFEDLDTETLRKRFVRLAGATEALALEMDFAFLFDWERKIFVIGYNVSDDRRDNSFYDLLASESRLASFIAIAKGDVPQEHWFRLGRQLTSVTGGRALVSWTATMFEYLMPLLVTRGYRGTLLEETYHSVVARQIEYATQQGVPWGISEAGYNARDLSMNYQYGPFGIPGLGLKRGLSDELVVSPYSTMLAALVEPHKAFANLKVLQDKGVLGRYGFFESIDYTPERLPQKHAQVMLRSFMAHHQGMSFVALNNVINNFIVQDRFHADPLVQATELLLQEKVPDQVSIAKPRAEEAHADVVLSFNNSLLPRVVTQADLGSPQTQILSNGTYSVLVSASGGGYSRCGRIAVNRWREDTTRDNWGQFIYVRNRKSGGVWTTSLQPIASEGTGYQVTFTEDKVDFWREDEGLITHTEILVAPEDNVEMRRVSITNTNSHE